MSYFLKTTKILFMAIVLSLCAIFLTACTKTTGVYRAYSISVIGEYGDTYMDRTYTRADYETLRYKKNRTEMERYIYTAISSTAFFNEEYYISLASNDKAKINLGSGFEIGTWSIINDVVTVSSSSYNYDFIHYKRTLSLTENFGTLDMVKVYKR